MIGYVLQQELSNVMRDRHFAALLTQVRVDPHDPAFSKPTKPIGPIYNEATAAKLAAERGWQICAGRRRRRASPKPLEILEVQVITFPIERGVIVNCAGGGGIPVVEQSDGSLTGIEAVIDKDLAYSILARQLDADFLLMLTDVDAAYKHWCTPRSRPLARVNAS